MSVSVIAKLTANEGQRDDLVAALQPMLDHVEQHEPGTVRYILLEDATDPTLLWVYEQYVDQDALTSHSTSETMKQLGAAVRPYAAARPEVIFCTPIGGKGL